MQSSDRDGKGEAEPRGRGNTEAEVTANMDELALSINTFCRDLIVFHIFFCMKMKM